jgi:hypothetical protein
MTGEKLQSYCNRLNAQAIYIRDGSAERDDLKALRRVAQLNGLRQITDWTDEDGGPVSCVIYRTPDGVRLNLWIEATEGTICEGGLGFDDNTGWYED